MQLTDTIHPHDPDAYEVRWDHDGHEHYVVVPRELLADSRTWVLRHAERVNFQCFKMFNQAGGDGRG